MEWVEGRITKRSVDAAKAPETWDAITEPYTGADKLELSSAREKILELMYEIEALKREHSGSYVENLKAELSVSYATNRGFRQQWEDEREENEKLNAALKHEREENEKLKHEREENEKLNAALKHEREENEKLNAALKHEREENEKLKHQREENEKLNAALKHEREENEKLKHEREENEKLNAALKHEREENEKLNATLKFALLENDNLIELTRSLREQADGLRVIVEIIADHLERGPYPLRLPDIIDGDDGEIVTDDLAA
jgi:chromosome segregation ATPase